jgi:hypothetical protein
MVAGGIVATIKSTTEYFYPTSYVFFGEESYYSSYNSYYYDDDDYTESLIQRDIDQRNEKRRQIKEIATSIAIIAVGAPLYCYHWKKIQTERRLEVNK